MIDVIESRIKDITEHGKNVERLRSRVVKGEAERLHSHEGETTLKKLIALLPASIVKVVKEKMQTMDEKEVLAFILKNLMSKK